MTEATATPEVETQDQQQSPPPKSKGAQRKRRSPRTLEQQQAEKAKKAELEAKAGKNQPDVEADKEPAEAAKEHQPLQQRRLEGEGFPENPPPEVCKARDEFVGAIRAAAKASKYKGERHQRLVEEMQKAGIQRIMLDGENKFFDLEVEHKAKMKTMPKEQRERRRRRRSR